MQHDAKGLQGKSEAKVVGYPILLLSKTTEQEHDDGVIDLSEELTALVKRMIDYLYTFDYPEPAPEERVYAGTSYTGTASSLHLNMYLLGDKYDIPTLRAAAVHKLAIAGERGFTFPEFLEIIPLAFNSAPTLDDGLREMLVQTTRFRLKNLLRDEFYGRELLKLFTEVPDYGLMVLRELVDQRVVWGTKWCEPVTIEGKSSR